MRPAATATYRLQLHAGMDLRAARAVVPYLARLGVSHVYVSPLLQARRESRHGYDVVDPTRLDPKLGTPADLVAFVRTLRRHGMGLVLDLVPNHMAIGAENRQGYFERHGALSEAVAGTRVPDTSMWYSPSISCAWTKPMPTMRSSAAL